MFVRSQRERLVGAALGGGLSARGWKRLERLWVRDPAARAEYEAMARFMDAVSRDKPEPPEDLLPGVRARLAERPRASVPRFVPVAAGMAIAAASLVYAFLPAASPPNEAAPVSTIMGHLAEADALAYQEHYGTAAEVLRTALADAPEDPLADRAEARLSELAGRQQAEAERLFVERKQYPAAYAAYRTLQRSFPDAFAENPENAARLDLLDEARQVRYASLERLDAARRQRTGVVEALESVIAAYPTAAGSTAPSLVASLATEEMVDHLADSSGIAGSSEPRLKALETARSRCSNPLALAHLEVALGRYHLDKRGDAAAARQWGEQALQHPNPTAVAMARDFLAGLPRANEDNAP